MIYKNSFANSLVGIGYYKNNLEHGILYSTRMSYFVVYSGNQIYYKQHNDSRYNRFKTAIQV
jgi:hypothetical protein